MISERPTVTPEQARRQLAEIPTRSLHLARDRKIHAIGTAVFGLTTGFYMAAQNAITGTGHAVLSCVFLAIALGECLWIEHAARTVPRRARLWCRLGLGASLVLALCLVLPWLNLQAQTSPNTWPMVLVAALVVAVPSLSAAAVIIRGRK